MLVNFTDEARSVDATGRVAVASDGSGEGSRFDGTLGPSGAVVLDPSA